MTAKFYVIYDGRARFDEDAAAIMDTANSLEEAREVVKDTDWVIFEYDERGSLLENGRFVEQGDFHGE